MMAVAARRILVEGIVQGVGFRPFVYTEAVRRGLGGWVRNTSGGVEIAVEGSESELSSFLRSLAREAPPLATIDRLRSEAVAPTGYVAFDIHASLDGDGFQPVSPDVATCADCLREILDPHDRRFGYPFTNCTRCGPRFTIIRDIPYDRPNTTMAGFVMCAACRQEYDDPRDRRFHAQPNACPACGPALSLVDASGSMIRTADPLDAVRRLLASGRIVAIKGLGGFHLACDATNPSAVRRLRERKGREAKPLALMVGDLAAARACCRISEKEAALLTSTARPIVLLRKAPLSRIASVVAPGLDRLGLMLPYTPLHHLLFQDGCPPALVMTSGNRSDEPIAISNHEALDSLSGIADAFLVHDRPIQLRCDDSVVRVVDGAEVPMRRSRGYAPYPVRLPFESRPILGCGAELKNTLCLTRGAYAFLSPHIGDLENYETFCAYREMAERMQALFRVRPEAIAHDLHPDYLSTRFAASFDDALPRFAVQHHHAHIASCMAEHGLEGSVIGVAFDGTGYGSDGNIWGGEFLIANYRGFERAAHLGYVPMPGGDRAVREPFRMALAHLLSAECEWAPALAPVDEATDAERRIVATQIDRGLNAPLTSSVGRLFDAVSSILGLRHRVRYEGEAAMELEALADSQDHGAYPVVLSRKSHPIVIEPAAVIRAVVDDLRRGTPPPVIAARFHATLSRAIVLVSEGIRRASGLDRVVLSGGVFQNERLLVAANRELSRAGFEVFTHHRVPPNDGGISLGQVMVASARLDTGARGLAAHELAGSI